MKNVQMTFDEDDLVIRINLKNAGDISKSGKSIVIATTEGNQSVPGTDDIKIGLNVYRPNK